MNPYLKMITTIFLSTSRTNNWMDCWLLELLISDNKLKLITVTKCNHIYLLLTPRPGDHKVECWWPLPWWIHRIFATIKNIWSSRDNVLHQNRLSYKRPKSHLLYLIFWSWLYQSFNEISWLYINQCEVFCCPCKETHLIQVE